MRCRRGRNRNTPKQIAGRKAYYERTKERYRERDKAWRATPQGKASLRARKAQDRARKQAYVAAYKAARGCIDCGERDPVVLDLDHCEDKRGAVSELIKTLGYAGLAAEMEKCVVRCANCHRRKTHRERDHLNPPRSKGDSLAAVPGGGLYIQ